MPSNAQFNVKKKVYNSLTDNIRGLIVFDDTDHKIYVGGNCFGSNVKDVTLNSSTNVLTITKSNGTTQTIDLNSFERQTNKVTSISAESTDTQYPSAKCIYEWSKDKSEVIWEAQSVATGVLASESDISATPNWQLTNLDMSEYQKVRLLIRSGGSGNDTTASAIIEIDLSGLNKSPFGHFIGSAVVQNPNNRNRLLALCAAISEDKTSVFFNRTTSLYGTAATSANSDGRVLYKIIGYKGNIGHDFQIVGPGEFTGKNFNLQAKYDGEPVTVQWSLTSGYQYAVINQWGRVDIAPNTVSQYITVQAEYGTLTDQKMIEISYDNQLIIQCPDTITGESGTCVAMYNNNGCVPVWSIVDGSSNATIDEYGVITILQSGDITVQAVYNGYTATKQVTLEYQAGTTQETTVNDDGSVTETTTTTTTDPQTGTTITETTSTTTNEDGSTSQTVEETTENPDGSSTTTSTTTNSDGTSSETESSTSAPDPETGATTTESTTVNYDENGDVSGSSENTTVENTDGSSTSTTTNYNAEGDPTSATNEEIDSDGNNSTQDIIYDENGDPVVTGYEIDTTNSETGEKTFDEDGVNTEFYGFDEVEGFVMRLHFTIDFTDQPPNQNQNHHQILSMKRANPSPWFGFQLRQSSTNKYIQLGTQFELGSNTNTTINPPRWIETNKIAEYDIEVTYDPTAYTNTFVCRELIGDRTVFTSDYIFPDIPELRYLTVCIGYGLDENEQPYRYANINVLNFSISKLPKPLALPVIVCDGEHISMSCSTENSEIYYKLNGYGTYNKYTAPITIHTDTVVEAYSKLGDQTSTIVEQTCIYDDGIEEPIILCDGEYVDITCDTPSVDIYYRFNQSGSYSLYEGPVRIYTDTIVEAYSTIDGKISEIVEETCIYDPIVLAAPVISCNDNIVTITCSTITATIYYRLNETGSFAVYTEPIEIFEDTVVEAYSTYDVQTSTTVTETCIYVPSHDYSQDYLTFKVLTAGTIIWKALGSGYTKTIEYSINNGSWTSITSTSAGVTISVDTGDSVRFRGSNTAYAGSKSNYSGFEGGTATYNIEGNIMSLTAGDNFTTATTLPANYVFCSIFKLSKAVSAENLILPVTTLRQYCYRAMFSKAPLLEKAPALPATTLAQGCYWYMFEECPITTAPVLNASTLVKECYGYMFTGCSSLNFIECKATTGFDASQCTQNWVNNVSPTGTFVKDGNTTWSLGISGIPTSWVICNDILLYAPQVSFNGEEIELFCDTEGADIYYRLDQSGSYSLYTESIFITEDTVIEAYSELDNHTSSITTQTCVYVEETPFEASNKSIENWKYNGQTITTPYSINAIDGHSANYSKGTFVFEANVNLKRAQPTYLWFQHADQSADIYVDDVKVETHWGGYNAFFSDISNYVRKGTNNIKVSLCNTTRSTLAPAAGDFNFNATLGNVKLFSSEVLPQMKYGYDGCHITSTVTSSSATIYVKTTVPNGATVVCKIDDENYHWTNTQNSIGEEITFTNIISGNDLHLWNGMSDPHLYTVTIEIYKNGDLYHRYQRPYGFRYYDYVYNDTSILQSGDPYTGFLLNGSPYLLRGVCMHDDVALKANALTESDYIQEFAIIQELGCNFIRLSHYPHPKEVYDWCDRLGIIVQTEVPCVNKFQSTMPQDYYDHLTIQYTEMVNQHYNHPCIMFWGLSNETGTDDKAFAKTKIEQYTALIKGLDSERWVGYVMSHSYNDPSAYYNNPTGVDWFGCNLYVGWYIDKATNDPTSQLNTRITNITVNKHKILALSEYGCGGTQRCHSDDFQNTTTKGNYARHDIEYQMWLHEGHIAAIRNFPQLVFAAEWQLFDIAVSSRNEGYTVCLDGENTSTDDNLRRLNNKGLVERDHITKKDTFYIYKAEWNADDKFVHICGKDYTKTVDRVIKCYTNDGSTLSLYVDNVLVDTATVTDHIAEFQARTFQSGNVIRVDSANATDTFTF